MLRKLLILLIKFIPVIQMAGMLINNLLYFNDVYRNMSSCQLNSGITYSNNTQKHSLIVISSTSTPAQFMNSLFHEQYHLISHIVEEYNINPFSEEAAYLAGFVGQRMYPKAKHFLCKCHCE